MSDESAAEPVRDHFSNLARDWSHFGPPLRPSADDTAVVQRTIDAFQRPLHAVVLGLTPEIVGCTWPEKSDLTAVDHSPAMIEALWQPQKLSVTSRAILADWRAMPVDSESIDLVAGDGCHVVLPYPDGYDALTREVRRILRPGGAFAVRVFLRPERTESLQEIAGAMRRGEVGSVHALKLRLLAALHDISGPGTLLDDVWRAWKTMPPLPPGLRSVRGWTNEEVAGVEGYRALEARYHLPTSSEFRAILLPVFAETACVHGSHELGERCPTFVFQCRTRAAS